MQCRLLVHNFMPALPWKLSVVHETHADFHHGCCTPITRNIKAECGFSISTCLLRFQMSVDHDTVLCLFTFLLDQVPA